MSGTEDVHLRLRLLDQEELDADPQPNEPFRLVFPGYSNTLPDGTPLWANIAVRLNSADLTALKAQIRAVELSYASRMGRMTDEQLARTQFAEALHDEAPPDVALLELVLEKLKVA